MRSRLSTPPSQVCLASPRTVSNPTRRSGTPCAPSMRPRTRRRTSRTGTGGRWPSRSRPRRAARLRMPVHPQRQHFRHRCLFRGPRLRYHRCSITHTHRVTELRRLADDPGRLAIASAHQRTRQRDAAAQPAQPLGGACERVECHRDPDAGRPVDGGGHDGVFRPSTPAMPISTVCSSVCALWSALDAPQYERTVADPATG
jgi:hypothetical protein